MDWLFASLNYYIYILIVGVAFFPLARRIFSRFSFDSGYPFAKVLAILLVSYATYVLGTLKILPFARWSIFLTIGIFALINYLIFERSREGFSTSSNRKVLSIILLEEFLFLASFLFLAFVRSQEPSIQSLEKFMDFGFMNSILRSDYFPPADIWYAPLPINYYYFGHLTGAFLIRLTGVVPAVGYNLILATIFGLAVTQVFSLIANIIMTYQPKIKRALLIIFGLLGAFIVNLGGNLHTIYVFTRGYPNESTPTPFWQILSGYNPLQYWYPNATRFIPFTIHEFPSYSYVVADLHGHVFDIPFVLLTLGILFLIFTGKWSWKWPVFLGFLTAVHYMTNAFDGPIYILLAVLVLFFLLKWSLRFIFSLVIIFVSFIVFSLPFSSHFTPFISGIGLNCAPNFLLDLGRIGPFLFERGNCQASPFWMLFILWGFFWISFVLFIFARSKATKQIQSLDKFFLILFSFGTFLIIIPEFFYIKDIYPAHFRANTMFKLGYQAFMMMGIASTVTFFKIKELKIKWKRVLLTGIWIFFAFFVVIYPIFSIPSYYGALDRTPNLDGANWFTTSYPEDREIVDYLNAEVFGQPVILEAQGDSYTDYERISAFTGLPTVAGWWVHEWLWRGSSDVVGERIPEVSALYESNSIEETTSLIEKYQIKYVIISRLERQKYPNLNEEKFSKIGRLLLRSTNGFGALYQVN